VVSRWWLRSAAGPSASSAARTRTAS